MVFVGFFFSFCFVLFLFLVLFSFYFFGSENSFVYGTLVS